MVKLDSRYIDQWDLEMDLKIIFRTILVMLMFIGACAGSTGGGIKVSRILILGKTIKKELNQLVHPTGIKKLQMNGRLISHEVLRAANVYMMVYL